MRTILFAQWLSAQFFKNLGHAVYKNLESRSYAHSTRRFNSKTQQLVHTCQSSTFTVRRYGAVLAVTIQLLIILLTSTE